MAAPVELFGITSELLESSPKSPEGVEQGWRIGDRGSPYVMNLFNGMHALCKEGSYFTAQTATPGTGVTLSVATGTTFSDTQSLIVFDNLDSSPAQGGQGRLVYPDFISITVTTAPTAATSWQLQGRLDSILRGVAGTQIGNQATNPRPTRSDVGNAARARVMLQGATANTAASANVRNIWRMTARVVSAGPVVGDTIVIKFGSQESSAGGVGITAAGASVITVFAPPVAIAPGHSFVLNEWAPARSAALSGEVVCGWFER